MYQMLKRSTSSRYPTVGPPRVIDGLKSYFVPGHVDAEKQEDDARRAVIGGGPVNFHRHSRGQPCGIGCWRREGSGGG